VFYCIGAIRMPRARRVDRSHRSVGQDWPQLTRGQSRSIACDWQSATRGSIRILKDRFLAGRH
jgi:hypothetical protein